MTRNIIYELKINWTRSIFPTDETDRFRSASGTMRLVPPLESVTGSRGIVDSCTILLDNHMGRFSPMNTSGPLYSYISDGGIYQTPVYLNVSLDNRSTWHRVFTGIIVSPNEQTTTGREAPVMALECHSNDELLLQQRLSSTQSQFASNADSGASEADIVGQWLTLAGIDPSDWAVDSGLFPIPYAWLDDESVLEQLWDLANACGGRFYCDADGMYRYENMQHWLTATKSKTSQATLTRADFQNFKPYYNDRELYNAVTVETNNLEQQPPDTIWTPEDTVQIPANGSVTVTAKMQNPAYSITGVSYSAITSGGRNISGDVSLVRTNYAERVTLVFTNANTTYAAILRNLKIEGIAVSGGQNTTREETSADAFWTGKAGRTRSVKGNKYVQTITQASAIATLLRDIQQKPRLYFNVEGVPGDPARRLGDRITVSDAKTMSSDRDGYITSITWRASTKGFSQDYECIDATDLYAYATTSPAYFVLNGNKLGSSDPNRGRLFY